MFSLFSPSVPDCALGLSQTPIFDIWCFPCLICVFRVHEKHQKHRRVECVISILFGSTLEYLFGIAVVHRSIPTSTRLDLSLNNKMSDNRNVDDVNREMDDIFLLQWMATVAVRPPRVPRWRHNRLDWNAHVEQLIHERRFANEYRMSPSAHRNLVRLLDPILQRVEWNSRGSEPILVEHIIALGL